MHANDRPQALLILAWIFSLTLSSTISNGQAYACRHFLSYDLCPQHFNYSAEQEDRAYLLISLVHSDGLRSKVFNEIISLEEAEVSVNFKDTQVRIGFGNDKSKVVFLDPDRSRPIVSKQRSNASIFGFTEDIFGSLWQLWSLILSAMVVLILIIRKIIHIREHDQLKVQDLLKNKLDERTIEVRAQSAEIEQKNQEITDSLNYAKHIQETIFPKDQKLREMFPGSFIFHQPRGIVSGDFYWFKRFEKKFLLACADATSHGLPGAFMSMIGSILLRDLSNMHDIESPNELLNKLDIEIRSLLKQRTDGGTSNDGMDITICEIDLESRKLRTASAVHSIFINRNGTLDRIEGDKNSIGGTRSNGSPLHFSMQEYALEPGDKIYLFSDGFQDQFGGMDGKKLKVNGTVDLIKSIMNRPMDEQSDLLRNKFRSWMNGFEQVDDVLFIGLQV